jgi:hypothetical protein
MLRSASRRPAGTVSWRRRPNEAKGAGADREAKIIFGQDEGETALSLALRNNHTETARLLQMEFRTIKR